MLPIVVKLQKVTSACLTEIKAQASGLVTFEYNSNGLKVRTATNADHNKITNFLKDHGVEFYSFNPNPMQQVKFLLRGLPPSMESNEIVEGLREKGVETSYARQIKRNITIEGVKTVTLLPLRVITVARNEENIKLLKNTTGILKFLIKVQDYKSKERVMQY